MKQRVKKLEFVLDKVRGNAENGNWLDAMDWLSDAMVLVVGFLQDPDGRLERLVPTRQAADE